MSAQVQLDYFYGAEADNFTFFRIPKKLFTDKRYSEVLSDGAKILYGLMLDRLQLSIRNGWFDDQHRAYIRYSVDEIGKEMDCGNQKVIKMLKELDKKQGVGLIESKRIGLGQANIYYVMNFASGGDGDDGGSKHPRKDPPEGGSTCGQFDHKKTKQPLPNSGKSPESPVTAQKCENHISGNVKITSQEVWKSHDSKCENHTSGSVKTTSPEMWKSHPNNTYTNETDYSDTDSNETYTNDTDSSSFRVLPARTGTRAIQEKDDEEARKAEALLEERARYEAYLRKQLDYDNMMKRLSIGEREEFDGYFNLILGVLCSQKKLIRIEGEMIPIALVKSEFMKLTGDDLLGVMERIGNKRDEGIGNIDGYVITSLYRNRATMQSRIRQQVAYEIFGEGYDETITNKSNTSGGGDQYMDFIKRFGQSD